MYVLCHSCPALLQACQALLSMEFSKQEYWSGLPCPLPEDLPIPGIESTSLGHNELRSCSSNILGVSVGCFQMKLIFKSVCVLVAQLCLILCDPMDCSPPGSSIHGISQARILEWVAVAFTRGSSWSRDQTHIQFNSDDHYLYYCGKSSSPHSQQKSLNCSTWV